MKQKHLRKVAAAALAGTMVLSCASCGILGGANKQEIIDAADEFAGALVKQDAGKIIKLTNEKKDSDAAEGLELLFDKSLYSDEQADFIDAVSDTLAYEVDEESVEVDKEEASVDVVFTMVDYEKALDGDFSDIDEVLDALKDCDDTTEVKVTFEFEKDDDEWLISNLNDKGYGKLFDFYSYELDITPALSELIDYYDCWSYSYGVFSTIYFLEDISDYEDIVSFDVYCDGALVSPDNEPSFYGSYIYCDYVEPDYSDLPSGNYEIVVKAADTEILSMTTTLEALEPQPTDDGPDDGIDYTYVYSGTGELGDILVAVDWYMDDGNGTYTYNYGGIEYDMYFTDELTYDDVVGITFNVYDDEGTTIGEGLEVYGSNISNGTNEDGYYYVYLAYEGDSSFGSGYYYIEVFNPDGTTLMTDYCYVN